jgi:hypothetical protein
MNESITCAVCATMGVGTYDCYTHQGIDLPTLLSNFNATLSPELLLAWSMRDRATSTDNLNNALLQAFQNFVDARTNFKNWQALNSHIARLKDDRDWDRSFVEGIIDDLFKVTAWDENDTPDAITELAQHWGIEMTQEVTVTLTITSDVTVTVPRGETAGTHWDFNVDSLNISHDEFAISVDSWEVTDTETL